MEEVRKKLLRSMIAIAGVFVLVFIVLIVYQGCSNKKLSYSQLEDKMKSAAADYFKKTELLPTEDGESATVSSDVLISNEYMKKFDEISNAKNCFGQVTVQKNNDQYNYIPYLVCDNYKTSTIKDDIISKVVTKDSGVYAMNGEYVYRGEKVDNYVSFGNRTWRIIKVTEDGYLKLIADTQEEYDFIWDNRYNVDTDSYDGIHDYEKSRIKDQIGNLYDKDKLVSESCKKKIVARDICVGKRDTNDLSINRNEECNVKSSKQYIDLIGMTDIAKASIDPNCSNIKDKSCTNYNYFSSFFKGSWTFIGVKGTTSRIYYSTRSGFKTATGDNDEDIYIVVYVNGNEKIKSGDGSKNSPYAI